MSETTTSDAQTVVATIISPETVTTQTGNSTQPDILTKVTQFKPQAPLSTTENVDIGFDYKEIEAITDPKVKEIAIKAYRSMQSGANKKFMELADKRRDLDNKISEMSNWSPERIQKELLNNPQFLQAAQLVAGKDSQNPNGLTDEEFSVLSAPEKAQITELKSKVSQLEQISVRATITQKDAQLQTKFADYNPQGIDRAISDFARLNPHEIREHVYKSVNHDDHVRAAYEMGKQEALQLNKDKINAISPNGTTASNTNDIPTKDKGESDQNFFVRLAQRRLAMVRK